MSLFTIDKAELAYHKLKKLVDKDKWNKIQPCDLCVIMLISPNVEDRYKAWMRINRAYNVQLKQGEKVKNLIQKLEVEKQQELQFERLKAITAEERRKLLIERKKRLLLEEEIMETFEKELNEVFERKKEELLLKYNLQTEEQNTLDEKNPSSLSLGSSVYTICSGSYESSSLLDY
jgi:predicted RNA binding protein with dsRBD fold (UPF0201 family)